jgi:DNA invertase Pin-like site-specific DNA recombinase
MNDYPIGLRILGYGRQSIGRPGEDESDSLSLDSQETRYLTWCHDHGAVPLGMIRDHDLSGEDPERPGIAELLERAESQKADAVWVFTLRRFSRDFVYQEITWRFLKKRGVRFLISELDPHTDDDFTRGIYGLMGQKQLTEQRAHVRAAFHQRAMRGQHHGPAPFGYRRADTVTEVRRDGTIHERNTGPLVIDPEPAEVIREMFRRYLGGEAMLSIAWDLERRGIETTRGRPWSQTVIRKMLRNPIYAGAIQLNGSIITREAHEPLISWDTFDRVQTRLAEQVVVRRNDSGLVSWCQEFVYHSCGCRMYLYGIQRRAPNRKPIPSFGCQLSYGASTRRCTEDRRHIVVAKVEAAARACLVRDLSGVASLEDAIQRAHDAAGGKEAEKARKSLADRRTLAQRRHDRALEYWLSRREKLSLTWMDEKDAELEKEIAAIDRDIAALPTEPDTARYAEMADQLQTIAPLVELASPDALREIMTRLGRIVVSGPGIQIQYRPEIRPFIPEPTLIIVPIRKHAT